MEGDVSVAVVGGGGHVGLPLSIVLANSGVRTFAFDISEDSINSINSGRMPFVEEEGNHFLREALSKGNLVATSDPKCISYVSHIVVVIGTPVNEHLSPDPRSVLNSILDLVDFMAEHQILLLRSTVFPGVTAKVAEELRKRFPRMHVAYCPERIIEGQALQEIPMLPQLIGADSSEAFEAAKIVFDKIGVESVCVSTVEAELAKLFTNVWRYIKFAAANQFWMMSNDLNVDYEKVRRAISYNYPRASDLPSAGFTAGPCLFKDTMQLAALVQHGFPLGHSAMMINEGMPGYLVQRLKLKYDLSNMTVGILGMSFKGNVDDIRSSLAYKLRKLLLFETKEVLITDPFTQDSRNVSLEEVLRRSDLLILGSPHDLYKNLVTNKRVIDIWGHLKNGVVV